MATLRKREGEWQVQVRRQGQPDLSRTFILQADAIAWALSLEASMDRGEALVDPCPLRTLTVDGLLERYLTTVTVLKRRAAYETARIKCLRRTSLAGLSLVAATPDKFAAYRDQRLTEVASATVRKEMALFRQMFRLARQEWALPLASNPVAEPKPPANGKPRNRRLSPVEAGRYGKTPPAPILARSFERLSLDLYVATERHD